VSIVPSGVNGKGEQVGICRLVMVILQSVAPLSKLA
jgi:hypothetical protein